MSILKIIALFCMVCACHMTCLAEVKNVTNIIDYKLTADDYRWMLTEHYDAFQASLEIFRLYPESNPIGIIAASESVIRKVFKKHLGEQTDFEVQRMTNIPIIDDNRFLNSGWVISLPNKVKIGLRQNAERNILRELVIGKSAETDNRDWFNQRKYSQNTLGSTFKLMFLLKVDDLDKYYSLADLLPNGAHYNDNGEVETEFERDFRNSRLNIILRNPKRKSPEEIYKNSSFIPPGMTPNQLLHLSSNQNRVPVAVFDSGVDYNHPDLAYKLGQPISTLQKQKLIYQKNELLRGFSVPTPINDECALMLQMKNSMLDLALSVGQRGYDFIENKNNPYDYGRSLFFGQSISHGTAVASLAAGDGIHTSVIPIRIIGDSAVNKLRDDALDFAQAVEYSKAAGARIINMSYGETLVRNEPLIQRLAVAAGITDNDLVTIKIAQKIQLLQHHKKIEIMRNNPDILFVLASGNDSTDIDMSSGGAVLTSRDAEDQSIPMIHANPTIHLPNVLIVAATRKDQTLSNFSVYGKKSVHLAAYGDTMSLPSKQNSFEEMAGTSFASATVSNAAAYIIAMRPNYSITEVISTLKDSVTKTKELESKLIWGGYLDIENVKRKLNKLP